MLFLTVHERLDRLPKFLRVAFGIRGSGAKMAGYSLTPQKRRADTEIFDWSSP